MCLVGIGQDSYPRLANSGWSGVYYRSGMPPMLLPVVLTPRDPVLGCYCTAILSWLDYGLGTQCKKHSLSVTPHDSDICFDSWFIVWVTSSCILICTYQIQTAKCVWGLIPGLRGSHN